MFAISCITKVVPGMVEEMNSFTYIYSQAAVSNEPILLPPNHKQALETFAPFPLTTS